jgi:hypothetical protein
VRPPFYTNIVEQSTNLPNYVTLIDSMTIFVGVGYDYADRPLAR